MKYKIIAVLTVFVILAIIFIIPQESTEPTGFVTKTASSSKEDMLFNYEIIRYPSSAEVTTPKITNKTLVIGVDIDPANLNFGIIPGNGSFSRRYINLTNMLDKKAMISIRPYGSIAPYVNFSTDDFILGSNEKIVVTAFFHTKEARIGNYTGEIDIVIKRPKYDFLYLLWGS